MGVHKQLFAASATAATAALVWAVGVERHLFTVRKHTLPLLQHAQQPLRVLHLSDLHLAPWQKHKIRWVQQLSQLKPDIVVLTGDLLGHKDAIDPLLDALSPLAQTQAQCFFVHGSNDYYAPVFKNPARYLRGPSRLATRIHDLDNPRLTSLLETKLNAVNLNNRAAFTTVVGEPLTLLGLNDPHLKYHDTAALAASCAELYKQHVRAENAVHLGVVHAPYQEPLNFLTDAKSELIFAGHTHGGQLRLPFIGALTSNSDLPLELARGLNTWHTAHNISYLQVSAGLGTSIYAPARFCCRPEASLLTLVPRFSAATGTQPLKN